MEIEKNIEQYEIRNNDEGSDDKIMAKKLDISLEKIFEIYKELILVIII